MESLSSGPARPFQSKSEYAYEEIKRRILSEELGPGAVVSQERIAAEIGVSTTPLREALKRLATEGMVNLSSHRDARVVELTADEARSLYEVRACVDPLAASLAAQRRTDGDASRIEAALTTLEPLSGHASMESLVAHRAFHRAVYRSSHNEPLIGVLEGLWDKADRYRQVGLRTQADSRSDIERVRTEHKALAAAVLDQDADRAEQVMRDHISGSLGRRAIEALGETSTH
ncbi:GntR family transcriptional regulator [Nocardioides sp. NPDC101246]|uniref:GntR family transcriptional regulator n=1 Tax=Nocardioides sp. NPDC101246 TaxID=3364336 RepID=UPI00380EA04D